MLDAAAAAGLTVIRTWAFNEGAAQWNALQPAPGQFCDRVFRALDWVVAEAGRRGLKLLLNLTNYLPDYGGMLQYVRWVGAASAAPTGGLLGGVGDMAWRGLVRFGTPANRQLGGG